MPKLSSGAVRAVLAAGWIAAAPVHAQVSDSATAPAKAPEVIVTGSRVRPRDLAASSPVVTVSPTEFQKAGALTVETLLSQYPQFSPSYSESANNPSAGGAAYLDLRGFGTNRTLVLVDGRRLIGSDSSNVVDVNTLPASLIQKVEIVSGGASAVYGPDAVAGVVNFVLRRNFEGTEFDLDGMISGRNDAARKHASLTFGRALLDQKLHAIVSLDYADRDELGRAERAFSSQAASPSPAFPGGAYVPGPNQPSLAAVNAVFAGYGVAAGLVPRNGGFGGFGFNPDGTLFSTGVIFNPFDAQNVRLPDIQIAKKLYPDVAAYNFEPENKLILPLERFSGTLLTTYKPNERLELFSDVLLTRYQASTALAASPAPTGPNPAYPASSGVTLFTIPVTNPFIPTDLKTLLASRTGNSPALAGSGPNEDFLYKFRSTSLGPRQTRNTTDVYNVTAGVKWQALPDWLVEAYVSVGRYARDEAQSGNLVTRKLQQLLNSPTGGTEYCAGGFNPFGQALSKACGDFVRTQIDNRTAVEQQVAAATATGPLFNLPAGTVRASLGVEHRHVTFSFNPDPSAKPGEIAGFNGVDALSGSTTSNDAFVEVFVPVVRDLPFVRSFDTTVGYRRVEGYGSGSNSYKAELRWTPVETLSVRGSYQRAVRAPSVFELYAPATLGSADLPDPCSTSNPVRTSQVLALCNKQAAAAGFASGFVDTYESSGSMGTLASGSTKLDPEKANTYTLGLIWQPRSPTPWLSGLRLALDGWWIRVKGAINNRDANVVVNGCYNLQGSQNPGYDPTNIYCQQLTRSSSDFQVINLLQPEVNQSVYSARGIDLTAGAAVPVGDMTRWPWLGRINLNLMLGWIDRWDEQDSPYTPTINFAGTIGQAYGLATPHWKGIFTVGWRYRDWDAEVRTRYIGAMQNAVARIGGFPNPTDVDTTWYVDLSAHWRVREGLELSAGVLNALDQDPRTFRPALDAQTDPSTYDVIGRRFRAGVNVRW